MDSYQIYTSPKDGCNTIIRASDNANIPPAPDNRDYVLFMQEWEAGAVVLDADGNPLPFAPGGL